MPNQPPEPLTPVKQQIKDMLLERDEVMELVDHDERRLLLTPLRRAGDKPVIDMGNDPTPWCFQEDVPYLVRPCIYIGSSYSSLATQIISSRYFRTIQSITFYAEPGDDVMNWLLRERISRALMRQKVWYPDGLGGHIVVTNDLTGIVRSPEFPRAAQQLTERLTVTGPWRRT